MSTPGTPPQNCPSLDALDILELIRNGALDPAAVDLLGIGARSTPDADEMDIVDPEGVVLTRLSRGAPNDPLRLADPPLWLSPLSARPFESLYQAPADVRKATAQALPIVLERPVTAADLAPYGERHLLLLVLAGPSVEPDAATLANLRSAVTLAETRANTTVVAIPLSVRRAKADPALRSAALAAYVDHPAATLAATPQALDIRRTGTVIFFTGLSGAGKSTVARAVRNAILERDGRPVTLLDGDVVRRHLSSGLGFTRGDRDTHIRRLGWVAAEIAHHGGLAICSPIAPYDAARQAVRQMVTTRGGEFLLVHISTPIEECERRDRKGLYARARRGEIPTFTGVSAPYEAPSDAALRLDTSLLSVDETRDRVLRLLDNRRSFGGETPPPD